MANINKRPQVIRDLIELADYIAEDNLDASDRFLTAAEETFQQLGKMPGIGRLCNFSNPKSVGIRQQAIKRFKNYLILYRVSDSGIDILRVIHGARDIEAILSDEQEIYNCHQILKLSVSCRIGILPVLSSWAGKDAHLTRDC